LLGKKWNKQTIDAATGLLEKEYQPLSDARASADARMIMAKNLLVKFWSEIEEDESS
jgi:xanthine dehydrogenase small subunit